MVKLEIKFRKRHELERTWRKIKSRETKLKRHELGLKYWERNDLVSNWRKHFALKYDKLVQSINNQ